MAAFCFFFLFSLLSFTSSATLTRRYLSDAAVLSPPAFFPLYSAPSPPPPPPPAPSLPPPATTVNTFPANISALVLPRSPKPQPGSHKLLVPVISAVLAVALAIGIALFLYGRYRSQIPNLKDESKSLATDSIHSESRNTTNNNLSVAATTSEILYHSNVVTSSSVDEGRVAPRSSFVKPESPEIRPLPPLPASSFIHYYEANPLTEEEDNDDFYSPLASLAGTENSTRPGLATQVNNPYSTCSCSSSSSHSPVLAQSVAISPSMSSTVPHWSDQNPKSQQVERRVRSNKRNGSLPLRMFSLWNQNVGFPRISSASTSPERGMIRTPDAYARSSMYSSVSTSPDRFYRKATEISPPKWTDLSRNVKSLLLSSTSISPSRDFCINISESSRFSKSPWENPEFATTERCESAVSAPPQSPPPPPIVAQKPPPLVPPSQPFVGKKLSFSELPQNCWEATERPKRKLKPLPWDKVRPSSYRKTSWDRLRSNSFKLNEGIVETPSSSNTKQRRSLSCDLPMINQDIRVSDPRNGQNITSLLTTLELTTKDVCQALVDGQYESLGVELLERLSGMAPSEEEEDNLKSYNDDSAIKLTPSDRFLKELINVPLAFERVDALLSVAIFDSKLEHLKKSFGVIQAACEELRNSKMLLRLLQGVSETGNRMKTKSGDTHDFKLDTVLELLDMQGLDGRTNLLHSVVHNIIESEGTKASDGTWCKKPGIQVIANLNSALVDVKKSADIDYDVLRNDVSKLYERVKGISKVLQISEESGVNDEQWWKFRESITRFLVTAAEEIQKIETKEISVLSAVKEITEYLHFHGDSTNEEAQVLQVFVIMRDFLSILEAVCKEMEEGD